ncbi:hypothetical protein Tco_0670001 [Tanacetum coccineum]
MGNNNKIALARFRIANLEQIIEDIQHQTKESSYGKTSILQRVHELPSYHFKGTERRSWSHPVCLKEPNSVFSVANCNEDCKVKSLLLKIIPYVRKPLCITTGLAQFSVIILQQGSHLELRPRKNKEPATGSNLLPLIVTCHAYGEKGHYVNQCRKTTNNNAQGRAYMLRDRNAHQNQNIVTGMFLLNQHLARVLFDSRADKSFVPYHQLPSKLNFHPSQSDTLKISKWLMET